MPSNTFEDYKKAIKKKYEIEKDQGHSFYLKNPTRGKLRNLCWELFQQQNRNQDDLNVFSSLLGLAFDLNKKNKFDEYKDKFRPIETFFKGETDPANLDAVNMAAILIDFKARPFNKFRIQELFEDEIQIDEVNNSPISNPEKQPIESSEILDIFLDKKESEKGIEKGNFTVQTSNLVEEEKDRILGKTQIMPVVSQQQELSLFEKIKDFFLSNFLNRLRNTVIATVFIFGLISTVIYFAFFKNHCMQWSEDHYEVVDCSLRNERNINEIIPLDNDLLNFRKLKACDTITCFKKNGEAFVWYGKTPNGIDFFNDNGNGRHPESKSTLRPVTPYIFGKYLKDKPCK